MGTGIAACHSWDLLQQLNKEQGSPQMQKGDSWNIWRRKGVLVQRMGQN